MYVFENQLKCFLVRRKLL